MGGASVLMGGGVRKKLLDEGASPPHTHTPWETLKPFIKKGLLEGMEGVNDNTSAFMHLNIKINNGKKLLFKPS